MRPVAAVRPPAITTTVSATAAASARSWTTRITDRPSSARPRSSRATIAVAPRSRCEVGSSAISTGASCASPTAICTRWSSPPESVVSRRSANSCTPVRVERAVDGVAVVARRALERLDVRRAAELDRLAHGHARGHRRALRDERAQPRDPAARAARASGVPLQRTSPPRAAAGPQTARESVDLPAPLGPTTASSSPAWTVGRRRGGSRRRRRARARPRASSSARSHRLPQQPQEQRHAEHDHQRPDRQLDRRQDDARERVGGDQQRRAGRARWPGSRSGAIEVPPASRTRCGMTRPRKPSSPASAAALRGQQRGGGRGEQPHAAAGGRRARRRRRRRARAGRAGARGTTASTNPTAKYGQTTLSEDQPSDDSPPASQKTADCTRSL